MRVLRGRADSIPADRDATRRLLSSAADGEPAVRVWVPHRQVAFGRRDAELEGYDRAREAADERGFPPIERSVGGRAVAYDGETTLAFARAEPVAEYRQGTTDRYERVTAAVERTLEGLGPSPVRGEPEDAFCPGTHSLSAEDRDGQRRKVVGIAQRVRQDAALVAGVVLVANREGLADVLEEVYGTLGLSLEPASVGSVADADGPADPAPVRRALEDELVGDATVGSIDDAESEP
ncbi:biotin/lipoate A/B protein ligase [Natrinema pellirubrum DSM 15624]|uniref:Biotin/lipoate A/B protein ligase n=1 Tax=Natrinema pellirubrum (strain DSM 15624 / CIP 106293 / JCM 10476 / NCIMB 786 / 157) TaxID=797303 RepID=L0JS68_NATP1|nr:lipoate--protein ligase family protein [Natrinema pellirubrum]AGB33226.1 lipoate-protein ligase A [Natrinema pellirubrum DSM 15624]ELY71592.1 biotin/lipoate A/B protein ligase [Natrinema pellirubrum DSM 15624]